MTIDRKLLAGLALVTLLGGCESGYRGATDDVSSVGEANRQTMMAQVIDPDPQYDEPLETSAEKAAKAVDRYRKDAVKKPERVRSTQTGSGGGS